MPDAAKDARLDISFSEASGERIPSDARSDGSPVFHYDVVVVGAGTGGVAAAIQAARLGASVALIEETDWVGGQMTAAAVSTMDEGGFNTDAGFYFEFIRAVETHYQKQNKPIDECGISGTMRGMEASIAQDVLLELLQREPGIQLHLRTRVTRVLSSTIDGTPTVTGIEAFKVVGQDRVLHRFEGAVIIDGTEYGDVIGMSPARFRVGKVTSDAPDAEVCVQDITYTAVIKKYPGGVPMELVMNSAPPGYQQVKATYSSKLTVDGCDWRYPDPGNPSCDKAWYSYPINWLTFIAYRSIPNSADPEKFGPKEFEKISRTGVNMFNDDDYTAGALLDPATRRATNCRAKLRTLNLLYYIQTEFSPGGWAIADDEGFDTPYNNEENSCPEIPQEFQSLERHFPIIPYVRESRRLIGLYTLTAKDIRRAGTPAMTVKRFSSSVAVGDYGMDLHDCNEDGELEQDLESRTDYSQTIGPFEIPFEVFIPEKVDGLLPAEKNLSLSRYAAGACRLQPVTMHTGQAAGVIAALSAKRKIQPRRLDPLLVQWELLLANARLGAEKFSDVPLGSPYWREVELVTVHRLLSSSGGKFGVAETFTRAQAAVMLSRLFELPLSSPPSVPTFADVPASYWAYAHVEAIYQAGITSGCNASPKQFCPDEPTTKGQIAIMVVRGLGLDTKSASTAPYYQDVLADHWAFSYIQLATERGLVGPCSTSPKQFCPESVLTRGDAAQVAARTLLLDK